MIPVVANWHSPRQGFNLILSIVPYVYWICNSLCSSCRSTCQCRLSIINFPGSRTGTDPDSDTGPDTNDREPGFDGISISDGPSAIRYPV